MFVLDASVAASWYFYDESDEQTEKLLDRLLSDGALAPTHWWFEIRNVVMNGVRRKRPTAYRPNEFLDLLDKSSVALAPLPAGAAVFEFALRHKLTFYDAAYLELAMRERIALATLDAELAAAARAEGVVLVLAPP